MVNAAFYRCNAARIFALDYVNYTVWQCEGFAFHHNTVFDNIYGNARIQIAENVKVNIQIGAYLDNIFLIYLNYLFLRQKKCNLHYIHLII